MLDMGLYTIVVGKKNYIKILMRLFKKQWMETVIYLSTLAVKKLTYYFLEEIVARLGVCKSKYVIW